MNLMQVHGMFLCAGEASVCESTGYMYVLSHSFRSCSLATEKALICYALHGLHCSSPQTTSFWK